MKPVIAVISAQLAITLVMIGCQGRGDLSGRSPQADDTVRIAAAWTWQGAGASHFRQGIELAVGEINAESGINGVPIAVHRIEDHASVHEGRLVAQRLTVDRRYAIVIGHLHSHVSLAVAPIYESAGLLMISPASTVPELTRRGYEFVFRSVNSDVVTARQLVAHAKTSGHRRVAICYVRTDYGRGLANAFERLAMDEAIEVVDRISYDPTVPDIRRYEELFAGWGQRQIDAVVLAGASPSAASVARALRLAGIAQPILGGDALDDQFMVDGAGDALGELHVLSVFHADNSRHEVQRFVASYEARYGAKPDSWASRGYEAVMIAVEAIRRAGSADSDALAKAMRTSGGWPSLHGIDGFDARGDPVARPGILLEATPDGFRFASETAGDALE